MESQPFGRPVIIPVKESGDDLGRRELESVEGAKYELRDQVRHAHPAFVELSDMVLCDLEAGIKQIARVDWFVILEPGLSLCARRTFGKAEPPKTFNVKVDYLSLSFIVDSRSHATWRNKTRQITSLLPGPSISDEQVDQIATEIMGSFAPHFMSLQFVLVGGLNQAQEVELDKGGTYNEPLPKPSYDPKTGEILGGRAKQANGGGLLPRACPPKK